MNYRDADDALLVCACLDGEEAAWSALVGRYQRLVFTIALRCGLDESAAADVFQTVFEQLHKNMARLTQPERLQAWIVTAAKREAIRTSQRRRREVPFDDEDDGAVDATAATDPLPDEVVEDLRSLNLLRDALDRLDTRCHALLTALFLETEGAEPSYPAIAARLGMPVGSLGPTRARCLQKLRHLMERR
jgi:RNA polymerase sigma factor (sigma-70 family)